MTEVTDAMAQRNNDRELWRNADGTAVFVTEGGGIGIKVGGYCIVSLPHIWHEAFAALEALAARPEPEGMETTADHVSGRAA